MNENSKRDVANKQNHEVGTEKKDELKVGVRRFLLILRTHSHGNPAANYYIGIDVGDKKSHICFMDSGKEFVYEGTLRTTLEELDAYFREIPKSRIALEVGTHSAWMNAVLESLGHEVYVANPRRMESIHKNKRKNDKVDARTLARLVRADPELLYPIHHRGIEARESLVLLRARDSLVGARTKLINAVRGLVKSMGSRIRECSAEAFDRVALESLPNEIRRTLKPLINEIASMTRQIRRYDKQVSRAAEKDHPETEMLKQVKGVGDLTSLAYVLTLEDPKRFRKSRDVGAYLGMVPKQDDSGDTQKQLRITKTGDKMMRRLLVGSAHYILGPFGEDCDLRRFGLRLAERGGKNAKKRAVVAVARKLGVLLHRLWTTGEIYEPLRTGAMQAQNNILVANA